MAAPNEPAETVEPSGGATVVVSTPAQTPPPSGSEEIQRVATRLEEIETEIRQGLEGNRTWTETRLSALMQEIADCRATLGQVSENLPAQMQALREELTQQLQELRQKLEASPRSQPPAEPAAGTITQVTATQITPPEEPPDPQESGEGDTPPIAPAPTVKPNARKAPRRV